MSKTNILESLEKIDFGNKRLDVHILCDLLFEYMQGLASREETPLVFNRFILVRALEEIFFPTLKTISGYSIFVIRDSSLKRTITNGILHPHHWLIWNDNHNYIIDVFPVDGEFGLSVPQAVIQKRNLVRFVPSMTMYPNDWNEKDKKEFLTNVENLSEVLQRLQEKVPF